VTSRIPEDVTASLSLRVDSQIRESSSERAARAERRVAEYLRTLGLTQPERVAELSTRFAELANGSPGQAVETAQRAVEQFTQDVFGLEAAAVDPLWLRAFIAVHPAVFLGEVELARKVAPRFGDPRAFKPQQHAQFQQQELRRMNVPGWMFGIGAVVLATLIATFALLRGLKEDGLTGAELLWAALFAGLFCLGGIGCTIAVIGFFTGFRRSHGISTSGPDGRESQAPLPRSALVMPIYEEDAEHVFAGLAAMREALALTPGGEAFEIFVLSDSRRPEQIAEEERAFRRVAKLLLPIDIPIYYRRRVLNERQKAGNLSEFFERFGHRYEYAVVLDADSLMRADTLVEMLRRMEAQPNLALLQAPLALHASTTLFARSQQYAASVAGPLFTRGLAYLAGPHGNYYGHNAIIRVRAFLECCSLPVLEGQPPLGGHILSHDFVEAALLCRAGWEVRIAHDLDGSWEELPETLPDYVARDRRWCQGNLQHLRVALAEGFKPMSRMHMWVGAGAYLAGPAWMCFTVIGTVLAAGSDRPLVPASTALPLMIATFSLLLAPRILAVLMMLVHREQRIAHGGIFRVLLGGAFELLLGSLLAPLMMVHHTRIVLSIITGGAVRWGAQRRRAGGAFSQVVRSETLSTVLGVVSAVVLALTAPGLLLWLAPIWGPLVLAIPIAALASSMGFGRAFARTGIFAVPSETQPDELLLRAHDLQALTTASEAARFRDLVLDPLLLLTHIKKLESAQAASAESTQAENPESNEQKRAELERIRKRALRVGPAALSDAERNALTADTESLRILHREAWRVWPVESWKLAREVPQLPADDDFEPIGRITRPSIVS